MLNFISKNPKRFLYSRKMLKSNIMRICFLMKCIRWMKVNNSNLYTPSGQKIHMQVES